MDRGSTPTGKIAKELEVLKQESQKLKTEQKFNRLILDNIKDMISVLDKEGKFVYVSPSHKQYTGYEPSELLHTDAFQYIHPEEVELVKRIFIQAGKKLELGSIEFRALTKSGKYIHLEGVAKPLLNQDGSVKSILISSRDISAKVETRKSEEAYLRAYEFLTKASMELNDLPQHQNIDKYITTILHSFLPRSIIVMHSFDYRNAQINLRSIQGSLKEKINWISLFEHLKEQPLNLRSYPVDTLQSGNIEYLGDISTEEVKHYFHEEIFSSLHKISPHLKVFGMGLIVNKRVTANVFIISEQQITTTEFYTLGVLAKQVSLKMEKREAKRELSESEKFYRRITENMGDIISITDSRGTLRYVSPSHEKILGYSNKEMIGKSIFNFLHPADTFNFYSFIIEKEKEAFPEKVEFRAKTKRGEYLWFESMGKQLDDENGNFEGFIFSMREISEKKETLNNLSFLYGAGNNFLKIPGQQEIFQYIGKKVGKRYRQTIVFVTSYNSKKGSFPVEFISGIEGNLSKFIELTGTHPLEMEFNLQKQDLNFLNQKINEISLKRAKKVSRILYSEIFQQINEQYNIDYLYYIGLSIDRKLYGSIIILSKDRKVKMDSKTLESFANQAAISIFRKNMEEELFKAKEKAEDSDRLKSAFLANMSHEIRTPMNGILGFSQLMRNTKPDAKKQTYYLNQIIKQSQQLLTLIDDIIDISKIEAGQIDIETGEVNLNSLMEELMGLFQKSNTKNLDFRLNNGLERSHSNIQTDEHRLKQVLTNLLSNAFKFTDEGEVVFGYRLRSDRMLEFYVKDTGDGIPEESKQLVFDRFKQAESSFKQSSGTGLGLAISREIAELMGGDLWVKSTYGVGSTFYLTIPYIPKENLTVNKVEEEFQFATALENINILIVEDDETSYIFLKNCFEDTKTNLKWAKDGEEAIKFCKADPSIDIVLMDIQLPVKDGYTATKEIKKFRRDLPIIAQTAYAMHGDKEKAIEAGMEDYITKPVDFNQLISKIIKVLKSDFK
ncbi:MAG: PAS domain S-box protein [Bacteroidales bacterium]